MRISIFLITVIINFSVSAMAQTEEKGHRKATKILVSELVKKYSTNFQKSIKQYNSKRKNITSLSKTIKDPIKRSEFLKYIKNHNIKSFSKIVYKNGKGKITIGQNEISFSVLTLFDRYILVNNKKITLQKIDFKSQIKLLKKTLDSKDSFSFFSLIINEAYATNLDKRFESSLFGAIIILNSTFTEHSLCYYCDDEYLEASRDNLEVVMKDISKRAKECKSGTHDSFMLGQKLGELARSNSGGYDLKDKFETYFKSYSDLKLSCESLFKSLHAEEISSLKKNRGYRDSIAIQKINSSNQSAINSYIKTKCAPYVELKKCLIDKTYGVKAIYNEGRKYKNQIRNSKSIDPEYQTDSATK